MSAMTFDSLYERIPKGDIKMKLIHENQENKVDENQSHMGGIMSLLERKNPEYQNHDHSLLQDPHCQGFKSTPRNYFILNINMRNFDGKDRIICIFQMDQLLLER